MRKNTPAFLTVKEAAEYGHVSVKTIRRRIDSGELPALKEYAGGVSKSYVLKIRKADLDKLQPGSRAAS